MGSRLSSSGLPDLSQAAPYGSSKA